MLMQVIAFFFEYFSREEYSSDLLSFCPGSLTYLLLHSGKPTWLSLKGVTDSVSYFGGHLATYAECER